MPRVRLIHWNAEEAAPLVALVRNAGYQVEYTAHLDGRTRAEIRRSPPDAFLIDLSRLPSQGREIAGALRHRKTTRLTPIVFLEGAPEKVEAIRRQLPDAVYTSRTRLRATLRDAIVHPPVAPVVPVQMMDRYGSRTAAQKLGIAAGASVGLIDAPRDYQRVLGAIPDRVTFHEEPAAACAVTLWFVSDPELYRRRLPSMRAIAAASRLWILWRKQAGTAQPGLGMSFLRESAIAIGLVDYKICSVNETWSALAFARKKSRLAPIRFT